MSNQGGQTSARPRHLRRAPISEALIDFRVQLEEGFSIQKFDELTHKIEREYPTKKTIRTVQAELNLRSAVMKEPAEIGKIVKSPDEKIQAQFRIDGFTLNRLEPYAVSRTTSSSEA